MRRPKPATHSKKTEATTACPYCSRTFAGSRARQARGAHIRWNHLEEHKAKKAGVVEEIPRVEVGPAVLVEAKRMTAKDHLDSAIRSVQADIKEAEAQITACQAVVDAQNVRLEVLRKNVGALTLEQEALNEALHKITGKNFAERMPSVAMSRA